MLTFAVYAILRAERRKKARSECLSSDGWRIVIHKCPAPEVGYWGEVPAMPGCASQGRTRAECRANVLEAATGCMESYLEFAMQKLGAKRAPRKVAMA